MKRNVVIPVFHSQFEDPRPAHHRFVGSKAGPGADSVVIRPRVGVSFIRSVAPVLTFEDRSDLIEALITQRGFVDRPFHLTPVRGDRDGQAASGDY
jgi:hypothetical protein